MPRERVQDSRQPQHRKHEQQHDAPQHRQRAKHQTIERTIRDAMTIPIIAGHLSDLVSRRMVLYWSQNILAICLGHAAVPGRESLRHALDVARDSRHGGR